MFAGLVPSNRVLGVHPVGQHYINDVDFRIVPDRIVVLIVVDVLRVHSVAQRQLVRFVGMAADQRHHLRLFTFRERRQDLIDREAAQPDDGPSHFLARRVWNLQRGGIFHERAGKIGGHQTLANLGDEASAGDFFGK